MHLHAFACLDFILSCKCVCSHVLVCCVWLVRVRLLAFAFVFPCVCLRLPVFACSCLSLLMFACICLFVLRLLRFAGLRALNAFVRVLASFFVCR